MDVKVMTIRVLFPKLAEQADAAGERLIDFVVRGNCHITETDCGAVDLADKYGHLTLLGDDALPLELIISEGCRQSRDLA